MLVDESKETYRITFSVAMDENYALEQDELDKGYVLTCQSHPTSTEVTVDFDV